MTPRFIINCVKINGTANRIRDARKLLLTLEIAVASRPPIASAAPVSVNALPIPRVAMYNKTIFKLRDSTSSFVFRIPEKPMITAPSNAIIQALIPICVWNMSATRTATNTLTPIHS